MIDEYASTEWEWFRTSVLLKDGTWISETKEHRQDLHQSKSLFYAETHPYSNITRIGKIQNCNATITVREREWQWKGISKIVKDIEVEFDAELGSEAGSWKGGTIGCLYEMVDGETPCDTLKRMERERQFK